MSHPFVDHTGSYLLSHSIGLPVRGAREAALDYFDTWEHHTADAWPRWLEGINRFRRSLARVISADPAAICPQSNVSSGLSKLLAAQRHRFDAPRVLISEDAFPSLGFVCERSGYDVRFLPAGADVCDPGVWATAADEVDVAIVTHVHSNTGVAVPVADVCAALRSAGSYSVVDVAQSVGIVPIDVEVWGANAVIGSCVKWLSGGPGAGWLWASPGAIATSVPTDVGWWSHAAPFEFDIHAYRDAPDALRFWGGSPTVLPFVVAARSIDEIHAIGVDRIRARNLELVGHLIAALGDRVTSPHDPIRRSGTAIIEAPPAMVDTLAAHRIAVDHRADGIRVSPHVHTTTDDLDRLIATLRA